MLSTFILAIDLMCLLEYYLVGAVWLAFLPPNTVLDIHPDEGQHDVENTSDQ